jgi:DNA-binding transcriptional MerR regulator
LEKFLPVIPAKRYFTISEVSNLCGVKPHVLRYWEQEFTQLRPMKRRGNRRYYQRHEVQMIRQIRDLLYDQGFTIIGARNKLQELAQNDSDNLFKDDGKPDDLDLQEHNNIFTLGSSGDLVGFESSSFENIHRLVPSIEKQQLSLVRRELLEIRDLLIPLNWEGST